MPDPTTRRRPGRPRTRPQGLEASDHEVHLVPKPDGVSADEVAALRQEIAELRATLTVLTAPTTIEARLRLLEERAGLRTDARSLQERLFGPQGWREESRASS